MSHLLLFLTTSALTLQSVFAKQYQRKTKKSPILFAVLSATVALAFFLVLSGFKISAVADLLPYSIAFSIAYSSSILFLVIAIGCGKLSITTLINSYSLIIPTLYGAIFLNEKLKVYAYIGFLLLMVSLFLVNIPPKHANESGISVKWVVAVSIAFLGNGMCSTIQKAQQLTFVGKYKNEFMIVSLVIAVIILSIATLIKEKSYIKQSFIAGGHFAVFYGLCNGIVNLLVMIVGGMMPISIMFPVISAGSIVFTSIISVYIYKESLSRVQLIGVILGILSIIFLNI